MPYTVPTGYFENITIPVREEKPAARVVSFKRKTWLQYAAAAVLTGLIVLLVGYTFGGHKDKGMRVMAKITRDVKKMNEVQKDNLLDFIDAGMSGNETAQVATDTKNKIKNMIQDVPDEELKDFQAQTEDLQDVLMTN